MWHPETTVLWAQEWKPQVTDGIAKTNDLRPLVSLWKYLRNLVCQSPDSLPKKKNLLIVGTKVISSCNWTRFNRHRFCLNPCFSECSRGQQQGCHWAAFQSAESRALQISRTGVCILTRKLCTYTCWGPSVCTSELEKHCSGAQRGGNKTTLGSLTLSWKTGLSGNDATLGIDWEKFQTLGGGCKITYTQSLSMFLTHTPVPLILLFPCFCSKVGFHY